VASADFTFNVTGITAPFPLWNCGLSGRIFRMDTAVQDISSVLIATHVEVNYPVQMLVSARSKIELLQSYPACVTCFAYFPRATVPDSAFSKATAPMMAMVTLRSVPIRKYSAKRTDLSSG
jgi:hypothetical protein